MQEQLSFAAVRLLHMAIYPVTTLCIVMFVTACAYFCWWYWKLNCAYSKFPTLRLEIKGLLILLLGRYPKNVPFSSALFQVIIKFIKQFEKSGFFVLWFFSPYLLIFREDIVKRLYAEPALINKLSIYEVAAEFFGNGLFTSKDDVWKSHRKLLNPVFQTGSLKGMMRIFNKNAAILVSELEKHVGQPTFDLSGSIKRCTFTVMAESILGLNLKDAKYRRKSEDYFKAMEELGPMGAYRVPRPWLHKKLFLPFFASGRKFLKLCNEIQNFTQEIVLEMKKSITDSEKNSDLELDNRTSFTRILLDQHLNDPSFTLTDVQDHITTIMAAGHDTTLSTLLWCLYALGLHPDVQEKAFKDVESLKGTDVTFGELSQLKYLDCVIKETLRLYTIVPIYGRKLAKEIHWENYTIPKGTEIAFVPYLLHKSPDVFPDPEKFDPKRFSGEGNVRPWTYLPFAEGNRSCIGKKFALMEVKVVLAHIIRRFRIETLEEIDGLSDVDWVVILKPVKPLRLLLTLR